MFHKPASSAVLLNTYMIITAKSVTKFKATILNNLVTNKVTAKLELLFSKLTPASLLAQHNLLTKAQRKFL